MAKLSKAAASARTKKGWQKRKRARPHGLQAAFGGAIQYAATGRGPAGTSSHTHAAGPGGDWSGSSKREHGHDNMAEIQHRMNIGALKPEEVAYWKTRSERAGGVKVGGPDIRQGDITSDRSVRTSKSSVRSTEKLRRESSWKTQRGVYTQPSAQKTGRQKKYVSTSRFIKEELAPAHKEWIDSAIADPKSEFNTGLSTATTKSGKYTSAGQRNRVRQYTEALQEGASHEEAIDRVRADNRGRRPVGAKRGAGKPRPTGMQTPIAKGRKGKYDSSAPRARELKVGISSKRVDSANELRKSAPGASDRDIVQIMQYQRMHLGEELQKNQRWTHETKRATYMGEKAGQKEDPNRVVFFTTNLGYPAPSVPSDSLIGQYVIRKRKNFLRNEGVVGEKDLRGKFPEAVRDMHVMEASTGISFGAEGRWGAFQKSGWRKGAKKSRNFGKPTPLGSQVLYDSAGRPIYDSEGNIRFTEGATRPFDISTHKDVGFRVFVG